MKKITELSKEEEAEALQIHKKAIVIDGLQSTEIDNFNMKFIQELRDGGFTAVCLSAPRHNETSLSEAVRQLAGWYQRFRELGHDKIKMATTTKEIREAKSKGWIAAVFNSQGSSYLEKDLAYLEIFHRLGVRIMQPMYQMRNQFGDGPGEKDAGLSNLGVKWVEEMNRLHMVISLSHTGYTTSREAIEISKDPVVFTHSNPRALRAHVRNIPDELIKACAEKGGVIGLDVVKRFGVEGWEGYLDHIDYVVRLTSVNNAGLGLDVPRGSYLHNRRVYRGERTLKIFPELYACFPERS